MFILPRYLYLVIALWCRSSEPRGYCKVLQSYEATHEHSEATNISWLTTKSFCKLNFYLAFSNVYDLQCFLLHISKKKLGYSLNTTHIYKYNKRTFFVAYLYEYKTIHAMYIMDIWMRSNCNYVFPPKSVSPGKQGCNNSSPKNVKPGC